MGVGVGSNVESLYGCALFVRICVSVNSNALSRAVCSLRPCNVSMVCIARKKYLLIVDMFGGLDNYSMASWNYKKLGGVL